MRSPFRARWLGLALLATMLGGCGSDALPPSTPAPLNTISVSGAGLDATLTPAGDLCHLAPVTAGGDGITEFDLLSPANAALRLYIAIHHFNGRVGGVYTDLTGGAAVTGTVIELSASGGRVWVGDVGDVTLASLNPPNASGSLTATLRPDSREAAGPVEISGGWRCSLGLTAAPTPLAS